MLRKRGSFTAPLLIALAGTRSHRKHGHARARPLVYACAPAVAVTTTTTSMMTTTMSSRRRGSDVREKRADKTEQFVHPTRFDSVASNNELIDIPLARSNNVVAVAVIVVIVVVIVGIRCCAPESAERFLRVVVVVVVARMPPERRTKKRIVARARGRKGEACI